MSIAVSRRWLCVLLLAAVCLGAAGCASTEQAGGDMPWNVQQSWEGSVSVPGFYQDR